MTEWRTLGASWRGCDGAFPAFGGGDSGIVWALWLGRAGFGFPLVRFALFPGSWDGGQGWMDGWTLEGLGKVGDLRRCGPELMRCVETQLFVIELCGFMKWSRCRGS
ncbi:hypothetical protein DL95DRAFT_20219 [Leptodontidium sp. 2 PMI_412]|nr:hypothetical protein DL95DRAFT_20219 [Leptodontidium sp. 2 PMI_412]